MRCACVVLVVLLSACTLSPSAPSPSAVTAPTAPTANPAPVSIGASARVAPTPTPTPTTLTRPAPGAIGRYFLQTRGLFVYFEKPASPTGWYSGQLLQLISDRVVQDEVSRQLEQMSALGVNEIVYEMRSGDASLGTPFPDCKRSNFLGPSWPQPTQTELSGLRTIFDLADAHGIRIVLILNNTHMEEQPPNSAEIWLSAILGAVKDKPALDLIDFGGDVHLIDELPPYDGVPDSCGGESEAPLWRGPDSAVVRYLEWAIGYGIALGLPAGKLTAEAIVGDYRHEAQLQAGPDMEDRHLWRPLEVLRTIYDRLGIAAAQRTYPLSFYSHTKCAFVDRAVNPCIDEDQYAWAAETLRVSRERVGPDARMVLVELGAQQTEADVPRTVEGQGALLRQLQIEGANYWEWSDPAANSPKYATNPASVVKIRGPGSRYAPVEKELVDLYGFHLSAIPNGSFEDGVSGWSFTGQGMVQPTAIDVSDVAWRGNTFLRLVATGSAAVRTAAIAVSPLTPYTTTANLRFSWSGDASSGGAEARPQVWVTLYYMDKSGAPSAVRTSDTFRFFQEDGASGFSTFPLRYATPADAAFVQIEIGAARNGLPAPITLDVDNVR